MFDPVGVGVHDIARRRMKDGAPQGLVAAEAAPTGGAWAVGTATTGPAEASTSGGGRPVAHAGAGLDALCLTAMRSGPPSAMHRTAHWERRTPVRRVLAGQLGLALRGQAAPH